MDLIFPQMAIFADQPLVYLVGETHRFKIWVLYFLVLVME